MEANKFYKIVLIVLVVINATTLYYVFLGSNNQDPKHKLADYFEHELMLNNHQKEQLENLIHIHRTEQEQLRAENRKAHDDYFSLLKANQTDSILIANKLNKILEIKRKEELSTFNHFKQIRTICNASQKQKFDTIILEATKMLAPKPPRR